jgi:hypothetical protein
MPELRLAPLPDLALAQDRCGARTGAAKRVMPAAMGHHAAAGTSGDSFFGVHNSAMVGDSVAMQFSASEEASFSTRTASR